MEAMEEVRRKRHDVFFSASRGDSLSFAEENAKTVESFLRNYLIKKVEKAWHDKQGRGNLSIFSDTLDTRHPEREVIQALLQTRGGGLVTLLITRSYFSNRGCVRVLKKAAELSRENRPGKVRLYIICLDLDADAVQHYFKVTTELDGLPVTPISTCGSDVRPAVLGRKIAEDIVKSLEEGFCVAGSYIGESFANLKEIINGFGPNPDILASRFELDGIFSSLITVLATAQGKGLISPRNVEKLKKHLRQGEGLQFVKSYHGKWLDVWTDESWEDVESPQRIRRKKRRTSASQCKNKWKRDFLTVPPVQEFIDLKALPSVMALMNAVLDDSSRDVVGAIGAHGTGGVGKTTACKIVASDDRVREKFRDGIFWMSLGIESTAEDVLEQLLYILKRSGGSDIANDVRGVRSKNMEVAVARASRWFSKRKVMVVVDNLWECKTEGSSMNWITLLRQLVGAKGRLLFSTRVTSIANSVDAKIIEFDILKDVEHARSIFNMHLELSVDDRRYNAGACDRILRACRGLPVAISIAARLVKWLRYDWDLVDKQLEQALVAEAGADKGGHPGLAHTISVTLRKLDDKEVGGLLVGTASRISERHSWRNMYYSLAVLPKSTISMPVGVLALLWGLKKDDAKLAVSVYCDLGLASMVGTDVLKLHDLQWQYCSSRCCDSDKILGHERLVRRLPYLSKEPNGFVLVMKDEDILNDVISEVEKEKCNENCNSSYLIENVVRHIIMGYEKLSSLLRLFFTDYRWIRKKAEVRDLMNVVGDYCFALNTLGSRFISFEEAEGYKAIKDALRRVPYEASPQSTSVKLEEKKCVVHGSGAGVAVDSGLAFQIVGRLGFKYGLMTCVLRRDSLRGSEASVSRRPAGHVVVDELLSNVFEYAMGSWLCPLTDVFKYGESGIQQKIRPISQSPFFGCVLAPSRDGKFVYSSEDHVLRKHDMESGGRGGALAYDSIIRSIAVASVGSGDCSDLIASGLLNGDIVVQSGPWGERVDILKAHKSDVVSLAVSRNGERVVSGSYDMMVRVWGRKEENSWTSQELVGHTGVVWCVAVSGDGREVASGSGDGAVRLWKEEGWKSSGERSAFRCVRKLSVGKKVRFIAFTSTEENAEVVFLLYDTLGVSVWDRDPQRPLRVIGEGFMLLCAAVSHGPESTMIIGGCVEGIHVWQVGTGHLISSFSGEVVARRSIGVAGDRQRIVTGTIDGVIEVWAIGESSSHEGSTHSKAIMSSEADSVTSIAVSEDRTTVVTAHLEWMQIWKAPSGSRVHMMKNDCIIEDVVISTDSSKVVTVDRNRSIVWWNVESGEREHVWNSRLLQTWFISLSRDGRYVAVAGVGGYEVWSVEDQEVVWSRSEARASRWNYQEAWDAMNSFREVNKREGDQPCPLLKCGSNPVPGVTVVAPSLARFYWERDFGGREVKVSCSRGAENSDAACSCTVSAICDTRPQANRLLLPYVRGLDTRPSTAKEGLGMLALPRYDKSSRSFVHELVLIVK